MLMWLVGAALAAAAVPAKQVPAALERIQDEAEGRVLVVAPSFGTKSYIEGFARQSGARATVVEGAAHADVCEALEDAGLETAVVVRSAPAGAWELEVVDDCFTLEAAPVVAPEPQPEVRPEPPAAQPPSPTRQTERPEPPAPPPAAPAPPATPLPTTEIRTAALTASQMRSLMALQAEAPNPTTALLASTFVGFGAGHFYSGDSQTGAIHAGIQGAGVLFIVGGLLVDDLQTSSALTNMGGTILTVGRLADIYTAPFTAHEQAAKKIKRGR